MATTEKQGAIRRVVVSEEACRLAARPNTITIRPDEDDGGYIAEVAEYPYFAGQGETPQAAEAVVREAIALAITGDLIDGRPLVQPRAALT